jgi:3-hydroxy-3-methylglutaryl CoA synthase
MLGITSYGAYIPIYRLSREEISRAWGGRAARGEKAIANYDEDSVTMAVEAVIDCLKGIDRQRVDGLYFASTTPPYKEKQSASLVALAADLRRQIFTADFTNSLRAGTIALRAAMDAVKSGSEKRVMVAASDCRLGIPQSEAELNFGDGAAALLIGDEGVACEIEGSYSHTDEFLDTWRTETDTFNKSWEDRFILTEGYVLNTREAISNIMKKYSLTPKDITKAVFYAPDARRHSEVARSFGFDPKTQVQEPLFATVGNSGCAFALMMLVAALESSKPGDRILFANYGDGCDAFILRVTEEIENIRDRRGIKVHLVSKMALPTYEKYLRFRQIVPAEAQARETANAFPPVAWREREQLISFHGSKCKRCGRTFHPMQRVCIYCGAKDEYEGVRLSDRRGTLYTFCTDNLALSGDPPTIVSKVHLDEQVGVYCLMTDRDPEKVKLDMPVEMTFRKMHDSKGMHTYYWKCRPMREA